MLTHMLMHCYRITEALFFNAFNKKDKNRVYTWGWV